MVPLPSDHFVTHPPLEKTLKTLLRQQRTKIEEIKKKTNYYNTRNLLERYDESPSTAKPADPPSALHRRAVPVGISFGQGPQVPVTPQRQQVAGAVMPNGPAPPQTPMSSALQNQLAGMSSSFAPPLSPTHSSRFLSTPCMIFNPDRYVIATQVHLSPSDPSASSGTTRWPTRCWAMTSLPRVRRHRDMP